MWPGVTCSRHEQALFGYGLRSGRARRSERHSRGHSSACVDVETGALRMGALRMLCSS